MKYLQNKLVALLFVILAFPCPGSSQSGSTQGLRYEVNRVYPSISISKVKLAEARTLMDLDPYYKPSWIREYISVEVLASYQGKIRQAMGKSETLSQEQKDIMNKADAGTDILVNVRYIPENTLKQVDVKEIRFTFMVDPENEAEYYGGELRLKQYLKEKAIDKIPEGSFGELDLAAVKFTVSEDGGITNVHVFETSKNRKTDELLLEAIRKMPYWKPAEYANGFKVAQEFVLTVGNMESCVINLLNIRRNSLVQNN